MGLVQMMSVVDIMELNRRRRQYLEILRMMRAEVRSGMESIDKYRFPAIDPISQTV